MRVCGGMKVTDPQYSPKSNKVKDEGAGQWHHENCEGLVRGARSMRCSVCAKYARNVQENIRRNITNKKFLRIRGKSGNFLHQVKMKALRKKLRSQQKMNQRLKERISLLTKYLEKYQNEVATVDADTLENFSKN
ncbi:hypothetical protein QAD02_020717 [Eretmocerus hayati]|uniref:Uncharacterized protein n=1 Tax=Eretmocerus hayati TaxID=131215 RepID=A0ACC2PMU2_9HYME|nr:hypothetical protein QAD02_020717 [Eretmocerus hayati]